jgi:hypothetical protein
MLHRVVLLSVFMLTTSAAVRAEVPLSAGASGAVQRAAMIQDARRNPTASSFGAPTSDDRHLLKLRWRLPWVLSFGAPGANLATTPFAGGYQSAFALPGLTLASEPMQQLSALVPQFEFGETNKIVHGQAGAVSASLGHGSIVDRYTNAPDGSRRSLGVMADINFAGLGATVMISDVLAPTDFVAGRVHGRPLIWFLAPDATFQPNEFDLDPRTEGLGMLVVGASAAVDTKAPLTGTTNTSVLVSGVDVEFAAIDNQLMKAILYVDGNMMQVDGANGFAVAPGVRFMWDVGGLRIDAEGEVVAHGDGYAHRYFDRLYMIERGTTLGLGKPKLSLNRQAGTGYQMRTQASLAKMLTLFVESKDQFAIVDGALSSQSSNMVVTAGASTFIGFIGAAVTASQTDAMHQPTFGPGFVVTAEARTALLFNLVHVVGRTWRAHVPAGDDAGEFVVDSGAGMGVELNFDLL